MANKHFVELGQDQEIIAPRQPRLENEGGAALPPTAYHPSTMLASTELGVYVKWALLLQEQLEHVQGERRALMQRCLKLEAENEWCRAALYEENPRKYSHFGSSQYQGECRPRSASSKLDVDASAADHTNRSKQEMPPSCNTRSG